jgi:hypothetical protein
MDEYKTPAYQKARRELLEGSPVCHWCKRNPATEADHLLEVDLGGSHTDGMVPACKPCNSRRGTEHLNRKRARQTQQRNAAMNTDSQKNPYIFLTNPTPSQIGRAHV